MVSYSNQYNIELVTINSKLETSNIYGGSDPLGMFTFFLKRTAVFWPPVLV